LAGLSPKDIHTLLPKSVTGTRDFEDVSKITGLKIGRAYVLKKPK
jgi:hypothetical protein